MLGNSTGLGVFPLAGTEERIFYLPSSRFKSVQESLTLELLRRLQKAPVAFFNYAPSECNRQDFLHLSYDIICYQQKRPPFLPPPPQKKMLQIE